MFERHIFWGCGCREFYTEERVVEVYAEVPESCHDLACGWVNIQWSLTTPSGDMVPTP